jgi:predicted GIY-YIG superfamily endonuclease
MFPWLDKAVNVASGGYPSQNFIDTLIPNSTMRDFYNALSMDDRESTVYNSKLSAIAAAYYNGSLPEDYAARSPEEQASILAKIENNAKSNLLIKGLFTFFLPLAPTVSNDYYDKNLQSFRSEYLNLLNQTDPTTGAKYTAASALAKFTAEHGNTAISYTVARSTSDTGKAYAPLADSTIQWIDSNQSLLNNPKYGLAAPYLIPQVSDSSDSLAVENKLVLDHFRSKVTPQEFISSLYVKQGWQDVNAVYTGYQQAMAQAKAENNRNAEYQYGQVWKQYAQNYGASNPVWYASYMNPTATVTATNTVKQLQAMADKKLIPDTVEGSGIKELLQSYGYYHQMLLANTLPEGKHSPMYGQIQDTWNTYLDNLAASQPRLASVISGVFRRVS